MLAIKYKDIQLDIIPQGASNYILAFHSFRCVNVYYFGGLTHKMPLRLNVAQRSVLFAILMASKSMTSHRLENASNAKAVIKIRFSLWQNH